MIFRSLKSAVPFLEDLWRRNITIGTVHTLGALHSAHARLIERSASENEQTIVTIYPNKIQLFPGSLYKYDLEEDAQLAMASGASAVIWSDDEEMFPSEYRTFIEQGESYRRLNSSVFDFASRGQVTGAIRWINFTRPTKTYLGLKDIEQAILIKRAVRDLLVHCEVVYVPCIRSRVGYPISSRLKNLHASALAQLGAIYQILENGRVMILEGERQSEKIITTVTDQINAILKDFKLIYVVLADTVDFAQKDSTEVPFIIHVAVTGCGITHFDGLFIRNEEELKNSPEVIWLN